MPGEMDEIVAEFLVESYESLDRLDRDLLALERDPGSRDVLASIFRTMHTIKGTCGFLGFLKLERIAHAAESLLAGVRDGSLAITPQTAGVLLATGDVLRLILRQIEVSGIDGDDDHDALVAELERLRMASGERGSDDDGRQATPKPAAPTRGARPRSAFTDTTVRVDVGLLDRLMTLVGELVLARNHLVELAVDRPDPSLASATQSVDHITAELQESVMKTRLQPIRTAWSTFPRVVRDLAVALDKRARIETVGDDTELDRSIIEAIKDPLTHIVRNAVDHGIEEPEVRIAAGKPAEGVVSVRAYHEGGQVTIEVSDDGAGIELEAVRAKAVELASMTPEQAARMSERDVVDLLFVPGFSTADHVTTVSGRGVGMDVVRTNIERIGGSIDVSSRSGEGTDLQDPDPAHARHHPRAHRHGRRRALRDPSGQPSRARRDRCRDRSRPFTTSPSSVSATGSCRSSPWRANSTWTMAWRSHPRDASSSCFKQTTAGTGSWSTGSATRPRSW